MSTALPDDLAIRVQWMRRTLMLALGYRDTEPQHGEPAP